MRKLWVLALKEVLLTFRDTSALFMMLATPLALTLVMMAAFGSGDSSPISDIPVLILNQDGAPLSEGLVDVFSPRVVGDLVTATLVTDEAAARARVEAGEVAALVVIPPDFSARIFPLGVAVEQLTGMDITTFTEATTLTEEQGHALERAFEQLQTQLPPAEPAVVEIYADPDWRISALAVKAVASQGIEMLNMQVVGISKIMSRLMAVAAPVDASSPGEISSMAGSFNGDENTYTTLPIAVEVTSASGHGFSWLGYYASSMAVLFLMFAVTSGGRTLLAERAHGTLPRLLITPTTALTVLVGKMSGIVLTGVAQMLILWGATSVFGAYWGNPLGVLLAIVVLVICASSVGALISAWAKTAGQASAIGSALTLVGGALSGNFFVRWNMPLWVQYLSLITPNAWGVEAFSSLQAGSEVAPVLPWLVGAMGLAILYYGVALIGFRRQFE